MYNMITTMTPHPLFIVMNNKLYICCSTWLKVVLNTISLTLQNDKISTADQQINSAFNGFSHIYLPLSFIEVIKCTGEFLQHQRKFVNGIHCRWKKGEGPGMPTCDEFNPLFPSTMNAVYKFPLMLEKFTCTLYHFYE
jgi:hypothetical protein